MKFDFVVWLRSDAHLTFLLGDFLGEGEDALREQVAGTNQRTTLLLLPSERVLPLRIDVPARSRRLLARALPFAVEEKLAVDLDSVHIAHGALNPGEASIVRVVDASYFTAALARVRELGLDVRSVQVDAERVPGDGALNILLDADHALIRQRDGKPLAISAGQLSFAVSLAARAQGGDYLELSFVAAVPAAVSDAVLENLARDIPTVAPIAPARLVRNALTALTDADSRTGVELLQGRFAIASETRINWGPWRPVAIAAAAWFTLQLILNGAQAWWLGSHADKTQVAAQQFYKKLFPSETAPQAFALRRAFRAHLGDGGPAFGARPMLSILASALGDDKSISLESLSYQRERDELGLQLTAGALADLERLKQDVERHGVIAQINSAEQEDNKVHARLRVRHGGQPG